MAAVWVVGKSVSRARMINLKRLKALHQILVLSYINAGFREES